jgi:hypothetical protein
MEITIVVGVIGGLIGAVLGAWCAVWFPRSANRRQATLQLLERYTSPEFFVARSEAWRIRRTWENGDRSCVWFFISDPNHPYDPDVVAKCSNGLTPHQNLSWLLHFFASAQLYYEAGLVDRLLLKSMFEPHYDWYKQFFREFCDEYQKQAPSGQPQPTWLTGLPKLEAVFGGREA